MEINEEVMLAITLGYMEYKPQFFGLNKKNQKCVKKWTQIQ